MQWAQRHPDSPSCYRFGAGFVGGTGGRGFPCGCGGFGFGSTGTFGSAMLCSFEEQVCKIHGQGPKVEEDVAQRLCVQR